MLTILDLSSNNIGGETGWIKASEVEGESKEVGAKVIYQGREMVVSKGVDSDGELKLSDVTGVLAIADALKINEVLNKLNISRNQIGPTGAAAIADALKGNAVLTHLDLGANRIRDQGAAAIAEALRGNGVLKNLYMGYNQIGDEGAKALASALRVNGVLTKIVLWGNNLGDEGKGVIRDAVSGRVGFELNM